MRTRRLLLTIVAPVATSVGLWACIVNNPADTSTVSGAGAGGSGTGGVGGSGGTSTVVATGGGPVVQCTLDNATDTVGLCTQKLVLSAEHKVAFDAKRGMAESWDSATFSLDEDASHAVLHDPRDDAGYGAAVARYAFSAMRYGDSEITATLEADLVALAPLIATELMPPPSGYAGELYLDLRTTAGWLLVLDRADLAGPIGDIADAYGRAIFTGSYVALATGPGDAGVTDGVLGTPATVDGGAATAYAPGDVATGAYALIDMAVRHATDEPANAALWQDAAIKALAHLDARAKDPVTGLYFASLITSADPGHDALAPADPAGPPADALLTDVAARVSLALLRSQDLATNNPLTLTELGTVPLEARAEALLGALDNTQPPLWDAVGGGYFTGLVPSTSQLLTDKPTRANALLLGALHRSSVMGNSPDPTRVSPLRLLLVETLTTSTPATTTPNTSFLSVVSGQNGFFREVPSSFNFAGVDAGAGTRVKSYFAASNAVVVEGLSELWVGVPD